MQLFVRMAILSCLVGAFLSFVPFSAQAADFFPSEPTPTPSSINTNPYQQTDNKYLPSLDQLAVPVSYATQSRDPFVLIGRIIRIALSFLGIGAVSLMVYAGFTWMTAAGNEEKVSEAKKTMRNAAIGLILILMSYSLTWFVVSRLQRATNTYGTGGFTESGVQTPTRGLF